MVLRPLCLARFASHKNECKGLIYIQYKIKNTIWFWIHLPNSLSHKLFGLLRYLLIRYEPPTIPPITTAHIIAIFIKSII